DHAGRRAAVRVADVVPHLGAAQRALHGGPRRAGARARAGAAARLARRRPRPDVDRPDRRRGRLCGATRPRGAAMSAVAELWPYVLLILVGFLPNEAWRMLGVVLARGLNEDSQIIVFARAVATAILTGVVGKLVVFAPGALASVSLSVRLGAIALGTAAFVLTGRSVFAGVATATVAIMAGVPVFR